MFAKAAAKHQEKYPRFNKFSLLCTDSLDKFNLDILTSIPVLVSVDTSSSTSSISYKTPNRSTIPTKNSCKNSVLFHCAMQKPAVIALVSPISVLQDSTPTLPKVDSTPSLLSIYNSVSACHISEIVPGANHFRIQIQINKE